MDWQTKWEYSKDGVCRIHGQDLGLMSYVGWNANDPGSPKSIYLVVTERNMHGLVKPYKVRDFDTNKF